jgi:hypothetical protein
MCTDAHREALMQDLLSTVSSTVSSAPPSMLAPSQRHATEAREGIVGQSFRQRTSLGQDDLEGRGVGKR